MLGRDLGSHTDDRARAMAKTKIEVDRENLQRVVG